MKTCYVVFYLNTSVKRDTDENLEPITPEFPKDWEHIDSDGYREDYSKSRSDYFMHFNSVNNATTWIKANLKSNHIYKICKWTIDENIKVFSNAPQLLEVETE